MNPNTKRIDASFIINEYGHLYEKSGQGMNRIKRALIQKAETLEKYAHHIGIEDDIYKMATDRFKSVIQPFRVQFEPKGGVDFVPNSITLQRIKIDLPFYPDDITENWLGFLEGDGVKREEWPITRYMIEVYLKQQIDYDREMNAVYKGVRNDTGNGPSDCMDGIRKKLIDGANNANNPINVIEGIQPLDETTCFEQIESFSKKINPIYQKQPIIICVAPEFERAFLENKRSNGFYFIHSPEEINNKVDFTKQIIMGLPSMSGTKDMFAYKDGNLLWLTRKDKFNFDLQKEDRMVKVLGDWREAVGFGVNKEVWVTKETVTDQTSGEGQDGEGQDGESQQETIVVHDINVEAIDPEESDVTKNSANLSGTINGDTTGATIKVAYGTTAALGEEADATLNNGSVSAALTSLTASTTYHWRIEVTKGNNKYVSATKTFTTDDE